MSSQQLFRRKDEIGISVEEAILIARQECEKRVWPWLEPLKVVWQHGVWIVHTNWGNRGANAVIRIDAGTGKVIEAKFLPR